jgi:hypothetical protein
VTPLVSRDGALLYLKNAAVWPEKLGSINRDVLWPPEDIQLETLVMTMACSEPLMQAIQAVVPQASTPVFLPRNPQFARRNAAIVI